MDKKEIELSLELLKNLPEGRKIYYKIGNVMFEVSKKEAQILLEEALASFEKKEKNKKEGGHAT